MPRHAGRPPARQVSPTHEAARIMTNTRFTDYDDQPITTWPQLLAQLTYYVSDHPSDAALSYSVDQELSLMYASFDTTAEMARFVAGLEGVPPALGETLRTERPWPWPFDAISSAAIDAFRTNHPRRRAADPA